MATPVESFPWLEELEKTVVSSLATSFGLDFLLFKDKDGGSVDTVHNARSGIYASSEAEEAYNARPEYDSSSYHTHENYIATGRRDKLSHSDGQLHDPYRNVNMKDGEKRNLDHVISAKEVHDDRGRVLAGIDGVELANQDSNLRSTIESINKSKGQTPIEDYLERRDDLIALHKATLSERQERLSELPLDTPEQRHNAQVLKDKIRDTESKIRDIESINPDEMRRVDKEARADYNQRIESEYYSSSQFLEQTAVASGMAGLNVGVRQMIGLVLAEVWFEMRKKIPVLAERLKSNFTFDAFISGFSDILADIWDRVEGRFQEFLVVFRDGAFSGVFSSLMTTVVNIFLTTKAMAVKIIREIWVYLVRVIKLLVFNPDGLSFVDLCKSAVSIVSLGLSTVIGSVVYFETATLFAFPFGGEMAAFIAALTTGIMTLAINYFLIYSSTAKKVWSFVESIMPHAVDLKRFQAINQELDRYLVELASIEFGYDVHEVESLEAALVACNDELQMSSILVDEVSRRNLELPYRMGDSESTRKWLRSKTK